MKYDELVTELKSLPATWYPALLKIMVEGAISKHVFNPGGLSRYVNQLEFSDIFGRVFDLLVAIGGAPESMRSDFLHHHTSKTPCDEYRFQGHLGFGGKYWRINNRVTCYVEDETAERMAIIKRLDTELAKLPHGQSVPPAWLGIQKAPYMPGSATVVKTAPPPADGMYLAWNRQSKLWEPKLWKVSEGGWFSMPVDRGDIWTYWAYMPPEPDRK